MTVRPPRTAARRSPALLGALALSAGLVLSGCGDDVVDDGVEQDVEQGVEDVEDGAEDVGDEVEDEVEDEQED